MSITVLDPTESATITSARPANRLAGFDGKVLGIYSNHKPNADLLLQLVGERIAARYHLRQIVVGGYTGWREMSADEWIGVEQCDAIIMGLGDCGTCSSSGMMNAMQLERLGIPSMLISTPPFAGVCKAMASFGGMPNLGWAIVPHPVGSLTRVDLESRADDAAAQFDHLVLSQRLEAAS